MKSLNANQHLNHEQICELLLDSGPEFATALEDSSTPAFGASRDLLHEHLQGCLICASELELLRSSTAAFRTTAIAVADRALARRPVHTDFRAVDAKRSSRSLTPAFFWTATALIFTAAIPLGLFHSNLNPLLRHHDAPVVASYTVADSSPSLESDEALLEGINQDLSASIPSPMQPLASPATSTASAQTGTHTSSQTTEPQ